MSDVGRPIERDEAWWEIVNKIEDGSPLSNWIRIHKRNTVVPNVVASEYSDGGVDIMVTKLKCVPLEDIAIPPTRDPHRTKDIEKWGTDETLMSARISQPDSEARGESSTIEPELPRFIRQYDLKTNKYTKYSIGDGVHRANRAQALGLCCIMAEVTEQVLLSKDDFERFRRA